MPVDRPGRPIVLVRALAWRTRREGLRYLFFAFAQFIVIAGGLIVFAALDGGAINGRGQFIRVATRYGAGSDTVAVGVGLVVVPGLVAVFAAINVGLVVRNLIGSEASRGGVEALLAGPYRAQSISVALLVYVGALGTGFWAGMTLLGALGLTILSAADHASLSLTVPYVLLVLLLPLLAVWAGTALSLIVSLLYPRLTQPGQFGIAMSGSGLSGLGVMLPAIGTLLVFVIGAGPVSPGELLAIAGGATAAVAVASALIVGRRFHPENVLLS